MGKRKRRKKLDKTFTYLIMVFLIIGLVVAGISVKLSTDRLTAIEKEIEAFSQVRDIRAERFDVTESRLAGIEAELARRSDRFNAIERRLGILETR